jgi:hypothetical protein
MITSHCKSQIEKRKINIDPEMIEFLVKKSNKVDSAFILGEQIFLGDVCHVILIVRHDIAITIEFRRKTQTITEKSLDVSQIVRFPCIF